MTCGGEVVGARVGGDGSEVEGFQLAVAGR